MERRGRPPELEARNHADFIALGEKIEQALLRIEKDRRLSATQVSLSKLAGCTRGTLKNRGWPLLRLKDIKEARRSPGKKSGADCSNDNRASSPSLEESLQLSRDEVLRWMDKYESVSAELQSVKQLLADVVAALESSAQDPRRPSPAMSKRKVMALIAQTSYTEEPKR